jgi:MFS family permease
MVAWCRISNRTRFGAVHGARSLAWAAMDLLLAWHLHVRIGLGGTQTGWAMCLFLVTGGAATALAGHLLTRYERSGAAIIRLQLPATCVTALLLWAQFAVTGAAAAIAAGIAFRLSYAVQDVTQNTLAALLPRDDADARGYAGLRVMLSAAARCLIVVAFALAPAGGMAPLLPIVGALMIASAVALRGATLAPRSNLRCASERDREMPTGWLALLLDWIMAATLLPIVSRLLIFAPPTASIWGSGAVLLGAYCLGTVIGPTVRARLGRRVALALVVASAAVLTLPVDLGTIARITAALMHGIGFSIVNVYLWAETSRMAMDEAQAGRHRDAAIFGTVIMIIHFATAVGMTILGPLIDLLDAGHHQAPAIGLVLTTIGALTLVRPGSRHRPRRRRVRRQYSHSVEENGRPADRNMAVT